MGNNVIALAVRSAALEAALCADSVGEHAFEDVEVRFFVSEHGSAGSQIRWNAFHLASL